VRAIPSNSHDDIAPASSPIHSIRNPVSVKAVGSSSGWLMIFVSGRIHPF
jgi:hypothetical protein